MNHRRPVTPQFFFVSSALLGLLLVDAAYAAGGRRVTPPPPPSSSPTPTVDIEVRTLWNGQPFGGAWVCAGSGPGANESLFGRTTSDGVGRATLRGIPAGGDGITRIQIFARRHRIGTGGTSVRPAQYTGTTIDIHLVGDGDLDTLGIPRECRPAPYSPLPNRITINPTGDRRSPVSLPANSTKTLNVSFSSPATGTEGLYNYEWRIADRNVLDWAAGSTVTINRGDVISRGRGTTEIHAFLLEPNGSRRQTESTYFSVTAGGGGGGSTDGGGGTEEPTGVNDDRAIQAFNAVANVFTHQRCFNCHASGSSPTVGDMSRLHPQFRSAAVDRRTDCAICHGGTANPNYPTAPQPPRPNPPTTANNRWAMPPIDMAFADPGTPSNPAPQVRLAAEICEQIKDTTVNGNRTLAQIVEHVSADRLVQWAWQPGQSLRPAPGTHQDFVRRMREWANAGGACPQ